MNCHYYRIWYHCERHKRVQWSLVFTEWLKATFQIQNILQDKSLKYQTKNGEIFTKFVPNQKRFDSRINTIVLIINKRVISEPC